MNLLKLPIKRPALKEYKPSLAIAMLFIFLIKTVTVAVLRDSVVSG